MAFKAYVRFLYCLIPSLVCPLYYTLSFSSRTLETFRGFPLIVTVLFLCFSFLCYHCFMSKNGKNGNGGRWKDKKDRTPMLKKETLHTMLGVAFIALALFLLLAPLAKGGVAGTAIYHAGGMLLGVGYFIFPLLFFLLGISFVKTFEPGAAIRSGIGGALFAFSGLGLLAMLGSDSAGGLLGKWVSLPLIKLFDVYGSVLFLFALFIISLLVIFDARPNLEMLARIRELLSKKKPSEMKITMGGEALSPAMEKTVAANGMEEAKDAGAPVSELGKSSEPSPARKKSEEERFEEEMHGQVGDFHASFIPPPLSLLEKDSGKPGVGDIKANANLIKRTLQNFGINVEMDEISIGPSVTRYALKPAEGVKLARIVGLQNELALALAAHPIRVEAPIPGTSLVGVEVPNSAKTTVGLGTLLSSKEYQDSQHALLASLGKSISGKSHFGNIAKMPHLLIAGATGSGKSVMVHSLITSLLYRNPPENLRFLMIDPKRVELTLYNGIPHLYTPVITDAKRTIMALRWAAKEMDRRYDVLEAEGVRDIASYHKNILANAEKSEHMPYIVIIIDELADIMQAYPRELESAIVRLAQMSRAVGIHLVLSTQRPSVNVITGLIKANIPTRIAFQVASQIDSRTILDASGAEKLLGAGDMLYMSGDMSKPIRLQSAFISENEVKKVVQYLAKQYENDIPNEITITDIPDKNAIFESKLDPDKDGDDDDLYEEARVAVIEANKASTSYLQRKLKIGYSRAARLIDMLEERGIVGSSSGAKPREVLVQVGGVTEEIAEGDSERKYEE